MKKSIVVICMVCLALAGYAQAPQQQEDKKDKIEVYRIAFITEKLELTPKEAEVFWPVYNEYSAKVKALREKDRERTKAFKNQTTTPTDQESEKYLNEYLAFRQQELDLIRKYLTEFKKVLPDYKVARLITLEQEFKHQLLNKLKDNKDHKDHKGPKE